ncbi:hypothetical protein CWO91_15695 [Bradyrhizobium genosp. SA-3]|uniref:hypothetical protein n=1 Tax=Bradyrhizobium genosp. SA-3 TaxID=508868 RepID=UPI00102937ED|nr:hypothetical protein [Bradyrhizobium genosp. SA-3]RZN09903.1 hypothetical protein CWO91_15695 [Bradyrhizobium genosp. SA-3]
MRSVTLLALSLIFVGVWSGDGARGQTSAAPPVSLAPPNASPPRGSAANSRIPPAPSGREASPPVVGGLPQVPNPAADYDGFSVGTDDNDTPSQVTPPVRTRAAKGSRSNPDTSGLAGQSSIDQDDEALQRKLTICKNCK